MTDCHSHILPRMDDGSRSSDESIEMLRMEQEQGVKTVILTPHFYADHESLESFMERRTACMERLLERINEADSGQQSFPELRTGAEVRYFQGIARMDGIEELRIEGTQYMLVELPFDTWSDGVFRDLSMMRSSGIKPIIAHVERYMQFQKRTDNIERLWDADVIIQSNASFFTERRTRRTALKLLKAGRIHLIGTDCHRAEGARTPDMAEALSIIEKKLGAEAVERLKGNGREILR